MTDFELSPRGVSALLNSAEHWSEDRTAEFYAVAQLLASNQPLTRDEMRAIGEKCKSMLERDQWASSNGAFNDE